MKLAHLSFVLSADSASQSLCFTVMLLVVLSITVSRVSLHRISLIRLGAEKKNNSDSVESGQSFD